MLRTSISKFISEVDIELCSQIEPAKLSLRRFEMFEKEPKTGSFGVEQIALSLLTILLVTALNPIFLSAQAWTKGEGDGYVKIAYGSSTASEQYSFDGTSKPYADNVTENAFFDRSIYLYGEYGLKPDITLVLGLPFKRVIIRDAAFRYRTFGFGDLQLGARYDLREIAGFQDSPNALAANAGLSLPLGYTRNFTPSAGSGQINFDLGVSYGRALYPFPGYVQAGLGFRHRSSLFIGSAAVDCNEGIDRNCFADSKPTYGDELLGSLEAGVTIAELIFVQALLSSTWSIEAPVTGFTVTNPVPTHQRFVKAGGGVAVILPLGFSVNMQGLYTVTGRNSVRSLDLFFGLDYSFKGSE